MRRHCHSNVSSRYLGGKKRVTRFQILAISPSASVRIPLYHSNHQSCKDVLWVGRRSLTYPQDDGHRAGLILTRRRAEQTDQTDLSTVGRGGRLEYWFCRVKFSIRTQEGSGLATSNVRKCLKEWWLERRERKEEEAAESKKAFHFTDRTWWTLYIDFSSLLDELRYQRIPCSIFTVSFWRVLHRMSPATETIHTTGGYYLDYAVLQLFLHKLSTFCCLAIPHYLYIICRAASENLMIRFIRVNSRFVSYISALLFFSCVNKGTEEQQPARL